MELVDECWPILEGLETPMEHMWVWPSEACPEDPLLPPFDNTVEKLEKETTDDSDDDINEPIPEPELKTYIENTDGHYESA